MRCIFCKQDSAKSKSVEHIVPESLGNKSHTLPKGTVCDKCNSYFALKIEKKVLETEFFTSLRHRNGIESKKRRIPKGKAIIPVTNYWADIISNKNKNKPIEVILDTESFELVREGKIDHLILPWTTDVPKDDQKLSRFLAKIGYEMMASSVLTNKDYLNQLIDDSQLDPLREYARFNSKNENWTYNVRQIYKENEKFFLSNKNTADMLFECNLHATEQSELYFVIAFKGFEFVINMGGPSIDGFKQWLIDNNEISPLYTKGKHFGSNLTPEFLKR